MENAPTNFSKLFVIGNGYDLHCNLHSSFLEYINEYANSDNNGKFFDCFIRDCENIEFIKFKEFYDKYEKINFWEFLLYYLNSFFDDEMCRAVGNWKDVEEIIANIFEKDKLKRKTVIDLVSQAIDFVIEHNSITVIRHMNNIKLLSHPITILVYIHKASAIIPYLYSQLNLFEKSFKEYMLKISLKNDYAKNSYELFNYLNDYSSNPVYILNFNYTSIKEVYKNTDFYNVIVENNVHGSLDNDIIIGTDMKYIEDKENGGAMYFFTKTYRKLLRLNDEILKLPDNVEEIFFYGHSLGEQDYSYFYSVFDHYNIYDSNIKLTFAYSNYGDKINYNHQLNNYCSTVYFLINKYSKETKKETNLLHRMILEGRIKIKKI